MGDVLGQTGAVGAVGHAVVGCGYRVAGGEHRACAAAMGDEGAVVAGGPAEEPLAAGNVTLGERRFAEGVLRVATGARVAGLR